MEPSDERTVKRRALLGGMAAGLAGLAGCTQLGISGGDGGDGGDGSATPTGTPAGTASPTASPTPEDAWGTNIPTYPYKETASEPFNPEPDPEVLNPVLRASHVTDVDANFVADPFLFVTDDGQWHMFFEAATDEGGVISHATSDDEGVTWSYDKVVLDRPYHLSYPYVFKWQGTHYMTTEEGRPNAKARLYKAEDFPHGWTHVTDLYDPTEYGHSMTDNVLFRWEDRWWSLTGENNTDVYAYYADELTGEWKPHKDNPVVSDRKEASRPGGRPIVRDDHILMFYQDNVEFYGEKVRAYSITELTPDSYKDEELEQSPVVDGTEESHAGDPAWNSVRMHHYDPWYLGEGEGWRISVDGNGDGGWGIGIYRVTE